MGEGIAAELDGVQLGDSRLNRRSVTVLEALAADPEASINAACDGWAETLAAYRFFNNPAVTPELLLQAHRDVTVRRIRERSTVLLIQDTTELDFTAHPPRDARCLDKSYRFGLYDHTSLAVTPDRLCLGVVGCEQFDRAPESLGQAESRGTQPIEDKESFRWLTGYRLACQIAAECPDTQIVSVSDREGDLYDIFVAARPQAAGVRAEFLIRSRVQRCLTERDPAGGQAAYRKVQDEVRRTSPLGTPRRNGRRGRRRWKSARGR
jgi:hypothetical protein